MPSDNLLPQITYICAYWGMHPRFSMKSHSFLQVTWGKELADKYSVSCGYYELAIENLITEVIFSMLYHQKLEDDEKFLRLDDPGLSLSLSNGCLR